MNSILMGKSRMFLYEYGFVASSGLMLFMVVKLKTICFMLQARDGYYTGIMIYLAISFLIIKIKSNTGYKL